METDNYFNARLYFDLFFPQPNCNLCIIHRDSNFFVCRLVVRVKTRQKLMLLLVLTAVAFAAIYVGLWQRLLPLKVMRGWFALVLIVNLMLTGFFTFLADSLKYVGASRKTTQMLSTYVCVVTFRSIVYLNPQIQIYIDESAQKWADIPGPSAIVLNHCSFWDAFLFVGTAPVNYIWNCKTLMKSSLRKIPIFGGVFDRVGHFPVYFKSGADGDFSVDKDRQVEVGERVSAHLQDGGRIAIFPEGAVNKTPHVLQTFRFGTFATIFQHRLPTYYFTVVGNNVTWPGNEALGGYPATIFVKVNKFDIDFDKDEVKAVAAKLQETMQKQLDDMFSAHPEVFGPATPAVKKAE